MTAPIEYGKTDAPARLPRWLTLVLISVATLVAIGTLWSLAPGIAAAAAEYYADATRSCPVRSRVPRSTARARRS